MTKILFDQGYILSYQFNDDKVQGTIKIALKYDRETKESVIRKLQRISTPGLRKYVGAFRDAKSIKRSWYCYRFNI